MNSPLEQLFKEEIDRNVAATILRIVSDKSIIGSSGLVHEVVRGYDPWYISQEQRKDLLNNYQKQSTYQVLHEGSKSQSTMYILRIASQLMTFNLLSFSKGETLHPFTSGMYEITNFGRTALAQYDESRKARV